MIRFVLGTLFTLSLVSSTYAQDSADKEAIHTLIDQYAQAREQQDTVLLQHILTEEVDQLVSSGEWRKGMSGAMQGMMRSSRSNPGERVLTVENVRFLGSEAAIADARYEIKNADGDVTRKMWSTFVISNEENAWKITAIRNMLPTE